VPYASIQDVERAAGGREKLEQLSDLDAGGQVDETLIADAVSDAESWINSFLQHRYSVPIPDVDVPEVLRRMTAREAIYILKERREALTEQDQERHEQRRLWLEGVNRGRVSPGVDPRLPKSTSVKPATGNREDGALTITRTKLAGWT
jgi:phage gp36-like protein